MVLSVDAQTSLPPRCRRHPTQPAPPGNLPHRHAHAYNRRGALTFWAAFDTRSGQVCGACSSRKRQPEFSTVLDQLDAAIDQHSHPIPLVCDTVSTHHGTEVRQWLVKHWRFIFHVTPVHGSWMHQVEPWVSILQRKRLHIADFEARAHLQAQIGQFIREWHQQAHPLNWSTTSVAKLRAEGPAMAA
jgi:hypothetical protein